MISRLIFLGLLLICGAGAVLAEDSVVDQLKLLEARQLELTRDEVKAYKADLEDKITDSADAQALKVSVLENKVEAIDNRVILKLGLLGLGGLAVGALGGLFAGVKWKSREVEKIFAKEADDFREKIRNDVLETFSSEDQELQNGLDTSIQKSMERIRHERDSKILIVTGEADHDLHQLLPRLGFDEDKFESMSIRQVFDYKNGDTAPADQDFNLVILDSLSQADAFSYIKAGRHHGYLLYKEGRYEDVVKGADGKVVKDDNGKERDHPYKIPRDQTIIANSKPTVYGHVMTLLSFNKGA